MSKVIALHHTEVILLRTDQVHFIKNLLRDYVIRTDNKRKCNDAIHILTTISKQLND
jgi:hypothetical protein